MMNEDEVKDFAPIVTSRKSSGKFNVSVRFKSSKPPSVPTDDGGIWIG